MPHIKLGPAEVEYGLGQLEDVVAAEGRSVVSNFAFDMFPPSVRDLMDDAQVERFRVVETFLGRQGTPDPIEAAIERRRLAASASAPEEENTVVPFRR
jgi:hypothetical protein